MTIAATVRDYLARKHVNYKVVSHPHTERSTDSARTAHIRPEQLAKAVVVTSAGPVHDYTLAVLPASRDIDIHALTDLLGAKVQMAPEPQLSRLFPDCEPGAIPAVGEAYDLKTVADTSLRSQEQIYFEAGDHEELICLSRAEFERLLKNSLFASFSFEPPRDRYDA